MQFYNVAYTFLLHFEFNSVIFTLFVAKFITVYCIAPVTLDKRKTLSQTEILNALFSEILCPHLSVQIYLRLRQTRFVAAFFLQEER